MRADDVADRSVVVRQTAAFDQTSPTIRPPAIQPSSAPPSSTITGKRSSSFRMSWLPNTMNGTLTQQAEDDQAGALAGIGLLGRAGDRDHVVERHHEVGDDDRLDRRATACRSP